MYGERVIVRVVQECETYMGKITIGKADIHAVTGTKTTEKNLESSDLTSK